MTTIDVCAKETGLKIDIEKLKSVAPTADIHALDPSKPYLFIVRLPAESDTEYINATLAVVKDAAPACRVLVTNAPIEVYEGAHEVGRDSA